MVSMALDPENAAGRFYQIVWPLRAEVLRMARILCGKNEAEADDLAQETLLKAFAGIDSFRTGTDARAWLMRILRNARIDRVRSLARESSQMSLDGGEIDVEARIETEEFGNDPRQVLNAFSDQQIIEALQDLPEEIRFTLLLVDVQQMDHANAADIMEVPVGTIKSRTHRGRAMLRQALLPRARELRMVK
ncbi:MAG TPA: sigma-70 family RNA polymerase sigma factor [Tepidisphaeraceae bacterium]|jgi:RNA polymerase sigma-70 factor (ECF subfamily)